MKEDENCLVAFYKLHRSKVHENAKVDLKPFYKHSLQTAWAISFNSLTKNERLLFSIFAMAASDAIPLEMFHVLQQKPQLPFGPSFCQNDWT